MRLYLAGSHGEIWNGGGGSTASWIGVHLRVYLAGLTFEGNVTLHLPSTHGGGLTSTSLAG